MISREVKLPAAEIMKAPCQSIRWTAAPAMTKESDPPSPMLAA